MCTRSWRSWESKWKSNIPTTRGCSMAVHVQPWLGCRLVGMAPPCLLLALPQREVRDGVPPAGKSHWQNPGWEIFPDTDSEGEAGGSGRGGAHEPAASPAPCAVPCCLPGPRRAGDGDGVVSGGHKAKFGVREDSAGLCQGEHEGGKRSLHHGWMGNLQPLEIRLARSSAAGLLLGAGGPQQVLVLPQCGRWGALRAHSGR